MNLNTKIIVAGRAQTGKTRIARRLAERLGVKLLKTCTTRPRRTPDEDIYHFYTPEEAAELNPDKKMLFTRNVDGYDRWTYREDLEQAGIAVLDPTGIPQAVRAWQAMGYCVAVVYIRADPADRKARWIEAHTAGGMSETSALAIFKTRELAEGPMFDEIDAAIGHYRDTVDPAMENPPAMPALFGEDSLSVWSNPYDPGVMDAYVEAYADKIMNGNPARGGWRRFVMQEPLILEPEDWTKDEWAVLCKLYGLVPGLTVRIKIPAGPFEFFVDRYELSGSRYKFKDGKEM